MVPQRLLEHGTDRRSLKRSLWIGIAAAIGATLLGLITAVGMTAHKLRLRGLTALVLPLVIPYIVLAVGL